MNEHIGLMTYIIVIISVGVAVAALFHSAPWKPVIIVLGVN